MTRSHAVFAWEQDPTIDRPRAALIPEAAGAEVDGVAWQLKRDAPRPHDLALSALAVQWMAALPEALQPVCLSNRFPRIANRLALSWKDATLAKLVLDDLLVGRRGGRKGFPADVRAELVALAAEVKSRQAGAQAR